jgi:hypothetical protein
VQGATPDYFHATGHAILTLVVALFGGLSCRLLLGAPADNRESPEHKKSYGPKR